MHKGSCLSAAVHFEVTGELAPPIACHCTMCRRLSGHFWVATRVLRENLTIKGEDNITWFQSSPIARRGFCQTCGAMLFFDQHGEACIETAMGAFEQPTSTQLAEHIHVASKGDYYDIVDGLPQNQQ